MLKVGWIDLVWITLLLISPFYFINLVIGYWNFEGKSSWGFESMGGRVDFVKGGVGMPITN